MDESHEGFKLLRGVRFDIKTLLTNFERTESVRFTDFCQEWKKMKFSLIFCERKGFTELLEFSEETLHIAKGYVEPPWSFHMRVGALFALYGLYFKQPIKGAAKIRFTLEEWQWMSQFVKECKDAKHYDICYIHYKLFINGAYVFSAVPRATGLERGFRKYELKCKVNKNTLSDGILKRSNIIDPELLDSLAIVESLYLDKKTEILGKKNLEFAERDFANTLKTKLEDFHAKIQQDYPIQNLEEAISVSELAATNDDSDAPGAGPSSENKTYETIFERELKRRLEGNVRGIYGKKMKEKSVEDALPDLQDPDDIQDLPEL